MLMVNELFGINYKRSFELFGLLYNKLFTEKKTIFDTIGEVLKTDNDDEKHLMLYYLGSIVGQSKANNDTANFLKDLFGKL